VFRAAQVNRKPYAHSLDVWAKAEAVLGALPARFIWFLNLGKLWFLVVASTNSLAKAGLWHLKLGEQIIDRTKRNERNRPVSAALPQYQNGALPARSIGNT
jgi:hypothetical protein